MKNKQKALQILKERNEEFISNNCQSGTFLGKDGSLVNGICKQISAEEMLNFMSVTASLIIEAMSENK